MLPCLLLFSHKLPHGGEHPRSDRSALTHKWPSFFFWCVCAVLACQQKWAGMDGFALRGSERGKRGTDIQGYYLMGLIWLLFHCVTPFPSPLPLLTVPLSIRCHMFLVSVEDFCCCWNTCFTNVMNLVAIKPKGILILIWIYLVLEVIWHLIWLLKVLVEKLFYIFKFWTKALMSFC